MNVYVVERRPFSYDEYKLEEIFTSMNMARAYVMSLRADMRKYVGETVEASAPVDSIENGAIVPPWSYMIGKFGRENFEEVAVPPKPVPNPHYEDADEGAGHWELGADNMRIREVEVHGWMVIA